MTGYNNTLTKKELRELKDFKGTIRQAEKLINRKLTYEEKKHLKLINVTPHTICQPYSIRYNSKGY